MGKIMFNGIAYGSGGGGSGGNVTPESIGALPVDGEAKSAIKAKQDGNGNVIADTYAKKTKVLFEGAFTVDGTGKTFYVDTAGRIDGYATDCMGNSLQSSAYILRVTGFIFRPDKGEKFVPFTMDIAAGVVGTNKTYVSKHYIKVDGERLEAYILAEIIPGYNPSVKISGAKIWCTINKIEQII